MLAGALAAAPFSKFLRALPLPEPPPRTTPADVRVQTALKIRQQAATRQSERAIALMNSNGDETSLPDRIACYSKGLPQNRYGEVDAKAYDALLAAMRSGKFADFERIPRAGGRRLSNPQSAYAFHLEGGNSHTFSLPPAPSIASPDIASDVDELYWQALCRDIPFSDFSTNPLIKRASDSLGTTPSLEFRGPTKGDLTGPYISQFLYKPIPYGAGHLDQKYNVPVPRSDFMTVFSEWSRIASRLSQAIASVPRDAELTSKTPRTRESSGPDPIL